MKTEIEINFLGLVFKEIGGGSGGYSEGFFCTANRLKRNEGEDMICASVGRQLDKKRVHPKIWLV